MPGALGDRRRSARYPFEFLKFPNADRVDGKKGRGPHATDQSGRTVLQ